MRNNFDIFPDFGADEPTCDNSPLSKPSWQDYAQNAYAENTLRAYRSDLEHFLEWGGTLPADPQLIARYLAEHAGILKVSTLERRLAALSKIHQMAGYESPTRTELVRQTMRGIARTFGRAQRQVAPITLDRLKAMVATCEDDLRGMRDRALLLVGFAGAFRRSELVAINRENIRRIESGIAIYLPKSKTDQIMVGREIGIPKTSSPWCPVSALMNWCELAIRIGPVFRGISLSNQISPKALSTVAMAQIIKKRAADAGLNPCVFSGHSLRAGFVTEAARQGLPYWQIKLQSGHKSNQVLERYIREAQIIDDNPLKVMFGCC